MLFSDFDFSALDHPTFKEDAVREEIVAPLLRRAGYKPTGPLRVQRSQPLKHPFVMIGSKRHVISIVPDYTLFHNDQALMILDAKKPSEEILNSVHVEQVYSYAIHPEVRCEIYGLCNGRILAFFHTGRSAPLFVVQVSEIDALWAEVSRYFDPRVLKLPQILSFYSDFGMHAHKAGVRQGTLFSFTGYHLQLIQKLDEHSYTVQSTCSVDGLEHMISFDLDAVALDKVLLSLSPEDRERVQVALRRAPFQADLEAQINVDVTALLCPQIKGEYEMFAPFRVVEVHASRYDPTAVCTAHPDRVPIGMPDSVFRLGRR